VALVKEVEYMAKFVLYFSDEDRMWIEAILMDDDAQEALRFIKEAIKPKIRAKGSQELDTGKPTGVMT
jgi:hypothetical protein